MTSHSPVSGSATQFSLRAAMEIAARTVGVRPDEMTIFGQNDRPQQLRIYNEPTEPCWWIVTRWPDHHEVMVLRSARVVLVGRQTGIVHFDGSACDEG